MPIFAIMVWISCWKTYKVRNGVKLRHTDGKLLTFVRCYAMQNRSISSRIIGYVASKILAYKWGEDYFSQIFNTLVTKAILASK